MFYVQAPGPPRAAAKQHRVVSLQFLRNCFGIQFKADAFSLHQADTAFHDLLGQLHVRNTVHEQAAGPFRFFDHGNLVSQLVQQVCRSQAGRSAADYGHTFSRAGRRNPGLDPALGEPGLDQIQFVIPVGNAVVLQVARFFAQCRADVSCKFREGCRLQQALQCLPFLAAVQQIVPLRDQVMQRASEIRLAERHAAVHAAGRLRASGLASLRDMQVFEVAQSFRFIPEGIFYSYCVQKSCRAAHSLTLPSSSSGIRLR